MSDAIVDFQHSDTFLCSFQRLLVVQCSMGEQIVGVSVHNPSPSQGRPTNPAKRPPEITFHLLSTIEVLSTQSHVSRRKRQTLART